MLRKLLPPLNQWFTILALTAALLPVAWGQSKFEVLYNFAGGTHWGALDNAVVFDQEGNLYGTAGGPLQ